MYNVPPKFNQICRLCLTVVEPKGTASLDSDEVVKKLSIFNSSVQHAQHKSPVDKKSHQINDDVRDDDQLKKKIKRSNEISISLSGGGSASVINNGFSSNDIDDDSERDISKRILQCLSIKVSQLNLILFLWRNSCKTHGHPRRKLRSPLFAKGPQHIRSLAASDCQLRRTLRIDYVMAERSIN